MNKLLFILYLFPLILLIGCQKPTSENNTIDQKLSLIKEKKEQIAALEKQIEALNKEVEILKPPTKTKKRRLVTITNLAPTTFKKYIEVEGIIKADEVVKIVSELPGRIIYLNAEEGRIVRKGDLIARLDLETLRKQKNEIQVQLQLADEIYQRQSKLWAQNIGSEIQYLQSKSTKERLEKSIEALDFQLSKSEITSPITGVVDMKLTEQGEMASPGLPIATVLNDKKVKVSADLPEQYLSVIEKGKKVEIYFPSLDQNINGRVHLLGRTIDPANRTLNFEVKVPNQNGKLKPNLLSIIKILEKNYSDTIALPMRLVQEDVLGNKFVMKVKQSGEELMAQKTTVQLGESYDGKILITQGLNQNDTLIDQGARLVSDGEYLKISQSPINING